MTGRLPQIAALAVLASLAFAAMWTSGRIRNAQGLIACDVTMGLCGVGIVAVLFTLGTSR